LSLTWFCTDVDPDSRVLPKAPTASVSPDWGRTLLTGRVSVAEKM
jgi:hypothetical protein